jgi:cyclic-di-GMP-binding protein
MTPGLRGPIAAAQSPCAEPGDFDLASTSSFDVTTGVDYMEVRNAVDQTVKEITQRYDFKGLKVSVELNEKEKTITLAAPDEYKLKAVWDVLQSKMVRRQVPLKNLDPGKVESAAASSSRQVIAIQDGLTSDQAREVVRVIKDAKLKKVQSAIQGDTVRISSADKDALQGVIALLKQQDFGVELKFGNYRSN